MDVLIILTLNLIGLSQGFLVYEETVMACMFDSDCRVVAESAKCMNKICKCDGNCGYKDTSVVTKIGYPCTMLHDCKVVESYCLHNVCTCKTGTIVSLNGKTCLKVSQGIGSQCIEDNQCSANVTSSICVNNVCTCATNMHLHDNVCIANKSLGERCDIPEECTTEYSKCDGTCKCIRRYVRNNDKCLLVSKTFFSPCMENIQCEETLGVGSHCVGGLCNCHDLYHFKATANKCIRDLLLGEVCTENEDCHQPGSGTRRLECILGECKCKPPYMQISDYCISSSPRLATEFVVALIMLKSVFDFITIL